MPHRFFNRFIALSTLRREGINRFTVFAHGQMQVGKFCASGHPHLAKFCTSLDDLSFAHVQRAFAQVTILRLPTVAMIKHKAIAAFTPFDRICVNLAVPNVAHSVSHAKNCTFSGGENIDTFLCIACCRNGKISAFVRIVRARTTFEIFEIFCRVMIHILLDIAVFSKLAVHRQRQKRSPRSRCCEG